MTRQGHAGPAAAFLAALIVAAGVLRPEPAEAQRIPVSAYYQHAAGAAEASPFSGSGVFDVQRFRLMSQPIWGAVRFDLAYEHSLTLRSNDLELGRGFGGAESTAPWLALQGTLVDRARVRWAHGLDRFNASIAVGERVRVTVGRQAVSWATALFFTPTDPFLPFDPADPFREYRTGVDAVRAVWFTGPLSELDAVVRPTSHPEGGESWTALLRGQRLVDGWEVSAWGGIVHDDGAAAVAATGGVGEFGLRTEWGLRWIQGETVVRGSLGVDRSFQLADRDGRAVLEVQHDGFGAERASELLATALSLPARRGELPVLGSSALVLNASWQAHPLSTVSLLSLVNLRDGSALVSPGLERSLSDEASLRLGAFLGLGPGADGAELRSEHGATPLIGFAALSVFF